VDTAQHSGRTCSPQAALTTPAACLSRALHDTSLPHHFVSPDKEPTKTHALPHTPLGPPHAPPGPSRRAPRPTRQNSSHPQSSSDGQTRSDSRSPGGPVRPPREPRRGALQICRGPQHRACPENVDDICSFYFAGLQGKIPEVSISKAAPDVPLTGRLVSMAFPKATIVVARSRGRSYMYDAAPAGTNADGLNPYVNDIFYLGGKPATLRMRPQAWRINRRYLTNRCILLPIVSAQLTDKIGDRDLQLQPQRREHAMQQLEALHCAQDQGLNRLALGTGYSNEQRGLERERAWYAPPLKLNRLPIVSF